MKPLNQWARYYGYNDFNTYIRAGGCLGDADTDIRKRIALLQAALDELAPFLHVAPRPQPEKPVPLIIPDALEDEPPETDNAHVQGAELG